jgi:hypothetical protein
MIMKQQILFLEFSSEKDNTVLVNYLIRLVQKKKKKKNLIHVANDKGQGRRPNEFISLRNILPWRPIPIKPHFPRPSFALRTHVLRFIHAESGEYASNPFAFLDIFFLFEGTADPELRTVP